MRFHFHIHHHEKESDILKELQDIKSLITSNHQSLMAKNQENFDALVARLDTITNDIATDYQTLLDAVTAANDGSVSAESIAKAEANIAKLEALGGSVENPVPPTP